MKQYIPLGNVISKASVERCGKRQLPILSITMRDGLVMQDEKFKKRIASADTADYKVIPRGKLVQGIHIDEANFGIQDIVDEGIVSPAYKVWDVESSVIYPKYLELIMRSPRSLAFYKSKLNGSVNRRGRMTDDDFLGMLIPFTEYSQQKRIVSIIDQITSVIALYQHQLRTLDTLIKARFVEMFGDPISKQGEKDKLLDIGKIFTGNTPSMKVPEYYESNDIPFIKPGDIAENGVTLVRNVASFISEKGRAVARVMPKGSVLVTCIGTIGKVGIVAQESCCNQQINFIIPNDRTNPIYLAYCLSFLKDVLTEMANAPVVPIINKSQFSTLEIPIVPKPEQDDFAAFVNQVDKSKFAVQKALDEAQLLFDSLMQKYFG